MVTETAVHSPRFTLRPHIIHNKIHCTLRFRDNGVISDEADISSDNSGIEKSLTIATSSSLLLRRQRCVCEDPKTILHHARGLGRPASIGFQCIQIPTGDSSSSLRRNDLFRPGFISPPSAVVMCKVYVLPTAPCSAVPVMPSGEPRAALILHRSVEMVTNAPVTAAVPGLPPHLVYLLY